MEEDVYNRLASNEELLEFMKGGNETDYLVVPIMDLDANQSLLLHEFFKNKLTYWIPLKDAIIRSGKTDTTTTGGDEDTSTTKKKGKENTTSTTNAATIRLPNDDRSYCRLDKMLEMNLDSVPTELRVFFSSLKKFFSEHDFNLWDINALRSACLKPQRGEWHTDYPEYTKIEKVPQPMSLIWAIEPGTFLHVRVPVAGQSRSWEIHVPVPLGSAILMYGDCEHAGPKYELVGPHFRLQAHMDTPIFNHLLTDTQSYNLE